jgi:hypothetical protein
MMLLDELELRFRRYVRYRDAISFDDRARSFGGIRSAVWSSVRCCCVPAALATDFAQSAFMPTSHNTRAGHKQQASEFA